MVLLMLTAFTPMAFAKESELSFGADGNFRIMQINDFQDTDYTNKESLRFLNVILDKYKPDLVVLVGDQIASDFKPEEVTEERIRTSLSASIPSGSLSTLSSYHFSFILMHSAILSQFISSYDQL